MAGLDYRRRRMFTIYAVAIMLILCALILTACNADRGTFDVSGETVSEPTHFIAKLMYGLNENIKIFGWTVIVFTVILKLVLSPLDIWQRVVSRRNAKAMERMRPQLEALAENTATTNSVISRSRWLSTRKRSTPCSARVCLRLSR